MMTIICLCYLFIFLLYVKENWKLIVLFQWRGFQHACVFLTGDNDDDDDDDDEGGKVRKKN